MPDCKLIRLRSIEAISVVAMLVVMAATSSTTAAAPPRVLAGALPPGHPSCHAAVVGAAELAANPQRRVSAVALERSARDLAAERKWGVFEQFDDTPVVSATLRVRWRGDPVSHAVRLECTEGDDNVLVCTSPICAGGEIRITGETNGALAVLLGGTLNSGRFIGHYIHLDESCEGHAGGPLVLGSEATERRFVLSPAPQQACR